MVLNDFEILLAAVHGADPGSVSGTRTIQGACWTLQAGTRLVGADGQHEHPVNLLVTDFSCFSGHGTVSFGHRLLSLLKSITADASPCSLSPCSVGVIISFYLASLQWSPICCCFFPWQLCIHSWCSGSHPARWQWRVVVLY